MIFPLSHSKIRKNPPHYKRNPSIIQGVIKNPAISFGKSPKEEKLIGFMRKAKTTNEAVTAADKMQFR